MVRLWGKPGISLVDHGMTDGVVFGVYLVGQYEQQDDNQVEYNLRGKFRTNEKGEYALYCLRPTPYPVCFLAPLSSPTSDSPSDHPLPHRSPSTAPLANSSNSWTVTPIDPPTST
jgi:hypothetical protein